MTYLEVGTCDGPGLMTCQVGDKSAIVNEQYLLNIDACLHDNQCLSFHQILSYTHKMNQARLLEEYVILEPAP